jgi:hypothetical protein
MSRSSSTFSGDRAMQTTNIPDVKKRRSSSKKNDVFRLRKVFDKIYLFTCPLQYDVNMHFCRYQEYYESPNDRFFRRRFTMLEYMRWYALERPDAEGTFSYVRDWSGFNCPSWVFKDLLYDVGIPDENAYDVTMRGVYETIRAREGDEDFYIIGCRERGAAIEHEVAHGLWHVLPEYKEKMLEHCRRLRMDMPTIADAIKDCLIEEGYRADLVDDETQAYLATGLGGALAGKLSAAGCFGSGLDDVRSPFIATFDARLCDVELPWYVDRRRKAR